jgi:tRNA (cmo5U34)-methyltransferase
MSVHPVNGFDRLAPFYDRLAQMLYGSAIRNAQIRFLSAIPQRSRVLILGGGTGWILQELFSFRPDCEVWYIESSAKMLDMARRRSPGRRIHFMLCTTLEIPAQAFDVIMTFFFLDLFSPMTLKKMIPEILAAAKPSALWLVADFANQGKWWQKLLLRIMYQFFRSTCHIDARQLPDWGPIIREAGFEKKDVESFYAGFIQSEAYDSIRR